MRNTGKVTAVLSAVVMVFSLQINVFAEAQQVSKVEEQPSAWASEAVEWAGIYGIAPSDMFKKYTSKVTKEELYSVCDSIYETLTGQAITPVEKSPYSDTDSEAVLKACASGILKGSGKFEPKKEVTRLDMVIGAYNVIKAASPGFDFKTDIDLNFKDAKTIPVKSIDAVKYVVSKGMLKGRNSNTLDLASDCSRQELIVFVRNAYEFAIYEAGRDSKGAFWKVSDEDSSVYLLGSIHVAEPSMYPLSKSILKAYKESDFLAVEANITNQQEVAAYMLKKALYTDDNTLYKSVPKEVYDSFVKFIEPYGIKPELYNKFKPWYAAMLVQNLSLSEDSLNGELGIDMFFLKKAQGQKKILEIEGTKFQVDMFDSFSTELQVESLATSLTPDDKTKEASINAIRDMIKLWKAGDTKALGTLVKSEEASPNSKEFNEKLWNSRDTNMAEKVKSYLADPEDKTYLVVVGAGHMIGETGIVAQLDDKYKIEQIK